MIRDGTKKKLKHNTDKGRAGYNEDCNGKYKRLQTFKMSLESYLSCVFIALTPYGSLHKSFQFIQRPGAEAYPRSFCISYGSLNIVDCLKELVRRWRTSTIHLSFVLICNNCFCNRDKFRWWRFRSWRSFRTSPPATFVNNRVLCNFGFLLGFRRTDPRYFFHNSFCRFLRSEDLHRSFGATRKAH